MPGLPTLTVSQKNSAITAVVDELQPVFTLIDPPLLDLFNALGLTLGADVTVLSLTADQPALAR